MTAPVRTHALYETYAEYVWNLLARLGVRDADLEDQLHEVFIIVHRRAPTFDTPSAAKGYLGSICRKLAANYRRTASHRLETPDAEAGVREPGAKGGGPEDAALLREAATSLTSVLDALSDDKRLVFVMFEIELRSADEIASELDIPVGTVHSRLHAARREFISVAEKRGLVPIAAARRAP
jgi:RNA polymerase sigma-70 factor (ECF subfamily)